MEGKNNKTDENIDSRAYKFLNDLIYKSRQNTNLSCVADTFYSVSQQARYYTEYNVMADGVPEKKAQWIIRQRNLFNEIINALASLTSYVFSLEETIRKNENTICDLYAQLRALQIENEINRQGLITALDCSIAFDEKILWLAERKKQANQNKLKVA